MKFPSIGTPTEPLENNHPLNSITQDSESNDSESDEDPFEPANPNLLIFMGRINDLPARILIDDGSVVNYIDENFCQSHNISIEGANQTATMANKMPQETKVTTQKLQISMGGYTKSMKFACIPLNYDLILGKKWTSKHKAVIDAYSNEVIFRYKGKIHRIIAIDPAEDLFISANTISNYEKKNIPLCAILIRPAPENKETKGPKISQDMEKVLKKYADVFPKQLPKGLPPKRAHDFHIKLKEGSTPQKKGLYRMSPSELAELKSQLEELSEQGFIRPSTSPGALQLCSSEKRTVPPDCVSTTAPSTD